MKQKKFKADKLNKKMGDKIKSEFHLTNDQLDELKEVGNIGAGKTSIALSRIINRKVIVKMTKLKTFSIEDFSEIIDSSNEKVVGISLEIKGDLKGHIILLNPKDTSLMIVDMINNNQIGTSTDLDKCGEDILKEMGNILVGSYLAAMSDLSQLHVIESLPNLIIDDAENVLKNIFSNKDKDIHHAISIGTNLYIDSEKFKEELILLLHPSSFEQLFDALSKI